MEEIKYDCTKKQAEHEGTPYGVFIAKRILHRMDQFFAIIKKNSSLLYYWNEEKKYFTPDGKSYIQAECQKLMGKEFSSHHCNEAIAYITAGHLTDRSALNILPYLSSLKNGIFNIDTRKLMDHTPSHKFISQLPVNYNPSSECPKFLEFLGDVLEPQYHNLIQEWFGYNLLRALPHHRALILYGTGRNGKTTLLRVLEAMLGYDNCSNENWDRLEHDPFMVGFLEHKMANIGADLPASIIKGSDTFKRLTGGDRISCNVKHEDPRKAEFYVKLSFGANQLPQIRDRSIGFASRLMPVPLKETFFGKKADKQLLSKLTTQKELDGIFLWALEGYERLMVENDFSWEISAEEMIDHYDRLSNPTLVYQEEMIEQNKFGKLVRTEAWIDFTIWCKEKRLLNPGRNTFYEQMTIALGPTTKPASDRLWKGYQLKHTDNKPNYSKHKRDHFNNPSNNKIKDGLTVGNTSSNGNLSTSAEKSIQTDCVNKKLKNESIAKLTTLPVRVQARKKGVKGYVSILRGTSFGNPYPLTKYSREESLKLYEEYLYDKLAKDWSFAEQFKKLGGKTIGCTCRLDQACHGDIIIRMFADRMEEDSQ